MLSLPDGNVLVNAAGTIYEFNPGDSDSATTAADAPAITNIAQNSSGSFLLTGTELTGINQGAYYGDDCQMDSNYPIVQFVNGSSVYYATTYNWSDTGIFSGSTPETVDFTLPLGIPAGTYSVYAVANGITSSPVSLTLPTTSDTGPTVGTPAAASATTVTGTTVNLSVLGSDPDGGIEPHLYLDDGDYVQQHSIAVAFRQRRQHRAKRHRHVLPGRQVHVHGDDHRYGRAFDHKFRHCDRFANLFGRNRIARAGQHRRRRHEAVFRLGL